MKTLHLNLKKKWFDMILSGEKKEEYRELKEYWYKRLVSNDVHYTEFDTVTFKNGYAKNARKMVLRSEGIKTGKGFKPWGAPENGHVFIIKLGKIIETENI